jgi:hypothetical protein
MPIIKIDDNLYIIDDLEEGDVLIFSKAEHPDDISVTPQNIYFLKHFTRNTLVLQAFGKGEKEVLRDLLKLEQFWYVVKRR